MRKMYDIAVSLCRRRAALCAAACLWLAGCDYDRFGDPAPPAGDAALPNLLLGELAGFYRGKPVAITEDIVVTGYVATSDSAGNFFRTLVIDDGTGALELKLGLYDLYATYPPGRRIVVRAQGLTLGADQGVLQLGLRAAPASGYETEYLGHRAVVDRYVARDTAYRRVAPLDATIAALARIAPGRLVRLAGLRYDADTAACWAGERSPVTGNPLTAYRQFRDRTGDTVLVATSGYAAFAAGPIPQGSLTLTGILLRGKAGSRERLMLKLRDTDDVQPE
ncbi:MAG: hypothetical protein IJC16_08945 [Rikenellaceae bacterium]|nr:hypothetical protein [Rikenellaceae bacterium]